MKMNPLRRGILPILGPAVRAPTSDKRPTSFALRVASSFVGDKVKHRMKWAVIPLAALALSNAISPPIIDAADSTAPSKSESVDLTRLPAIEVPAPTGTNRVTAAAIIQPAIASPGDSITVIVKVRIASGHWIYALEKSGSSNLPTALETPSDWQPLGSASPWRGPEPKTKEDGSRIYAGEAVFQRRFVLGSPAKGAIRRLPITIKYQVCNEALCWPPATISLEPVLKVVQSQ